MAELDYNSEDLIAQDFCAATRDLELEKNQILLKDWLPMSYSGQLLVLRQGKHGFGTEEAVIEAGHGGEVKGALDEVFENDMGAALTIVEKD